MPERTEVTTTRRPARLDVARTEPSAASEGGRLVRKATASENERSRSPSRQACATRSLGASFRRTFLTRRIVASTGVGEGAAAVSLRLGL